MMPDLILYSFWNGCPNNYGQVIQDGIQALFENLPDEGKERLIYNLDFFR